jgi:enamine deaminase RidA (YjgF/YER057c/UK114 family)
VWSFRDANCLPGFNQHPAVIDGCSDLLVRVFDDAGRGTRSAVGMAELPFDISVEIEAVVQVSKITMWEVTSLSSA